MAQTSEQYAQAQHRAWAKLQPGPAQYVRSRCPHGLSKGECPCRAPLTFVVDVEFSTHDALKEGHTALGVNTVRVHVPWTPPWGPDPEVEATLVAAQMTACHGVLPTRTTVVQVCI